MEYPSNDDLLNSMINDALNNPTPVGKTLLDFLTMEPKDVSERLAWYIGAHLPDNLTRSLIRNHMDPGTMAAGVVWAMNHIYQHGMPIDFEDIISGRKE
jgi:hypothetical protein